MRSSSIRHFGVRVQWAKIVFKCHSMRVVTAYTFSWNLLGKILRGSCCKFELHPRFPPVFVFGVGIVQHHRLFHSLARRPRNVMCALSVSRPVFPNLFRRDALFDEIVPVFVFPPTTCDNASRAKPHGYRHNVKNFNKDKTIVLKSFVQLMSVYKCYLCEIGSLLVFQKFYLNQFFS